MTWIELGFASFMIVFAGIVRGYSGFGFAVIAALCLNFLVAPLESIVIAVALDLLSSLSLIRSASTQIDKPLVTKLISGMLVATPFSLWVVSYISADGLKFLIAGLSMTAGGLIMLDLRLKWLDERYSFAVGAVSGFGMTAGSAGGPPLILYLLNLMMESNQLRATAIVFFMASASTSIIGLAIIGAVDGQLIVTSMGLLPSALMGNLMGKKLHQWLPEWPPRLTTAPILMGLALMTFLL
ncbi:sulfite exporter TauE/SafE family protein [Vibrio sp. SM6]|uniref:Probable membrane transporter protein n=1 Tax=Vibrio agarilyticus TaxID=2726741 RepID=A0A7X8TNB2_9VIBR|nr:sulfite exporter TauE/SafE family protein [Vibrio agarilyticus]NLS11730.1 sulfite exporter TauE/SafE family protein [Vibrio agarilyticus]